MLDRMERIVAAIARRHSPLTIPALCAKSACRRSRTCHRAGLAQGVGARSGDCAGATAAQQIRRELRKMTRQKSCTPEAA
ncbi:MAG: hypothetical protein AB7O50_15785 [Pseudolabrys sp.]